MDAKLCLDPSFQSGIEGCPGTRFLVQLKQSPIVIDHEKEQSPLLVSDITTNVTTEHKAVSLPQELTVLFVDDDTILRRMFIRALKRMCPTWTIDEASNGETSLRLVEAKRYDVIFMDQYVSVKYQCFECRYHVFENLISVYLFARPASLDNM